MAETVQKALARAFSSDGAPGAAMVACACALAVACGFSLWRAYESWRRSKAHRASVLPGRSSADGAGDKSLGGRVVSLMATLSREASTKPGSKEPPFSRRNEGQLASELRLAGISGRVTPRGFGEARVRLAAMGACLGLLAGAMFSAPLACIGLLAGATLGWRLPSRTVRACIKERTHESERHLPEMLDVVALGMRSGLSFDSSLRIYAQHFDTVLSRELESARVQWSSGLVRREEALRELASTYDSVVFGRVVETIIRSIRYGSSMVDSLESDAAEARSAYQAEREERVAKTPVKMMVPTGVLILPAMLVLVLGPVLLELMEGGL